MHDRGKVCCSCNENVIYHKGFYNDENYMNSFYEIRYDTFFELPDDDDFVCDRADVLLCGACHIFATALQKKLGYNLYVIEENKEATRKGFHAFCQVYEFDRIYYVDARGMTSSFDEFMDIAKTFVGGEYIIRPVRPDELDDWKKDDYYKELLSFAESVIEKYKQCYTL